MLTRRLPVSIGSCGGARPGRPSYHHADTPRQEARTKFCEWQQRFVSGEIGVDFCNLYNAADHARHGILPIAEVFGIGSQAAAKSTAAGASTIADCTARDLHAVCDLLTITGTRVQAELRGLSCLPLSLMATARRGIDYYPHGRPRSCGRRILKLATSPFSRTRAGTMAIRGLVPEDRAPQYLGLVHGYDGRPKCRLFDLLQNRGLQANQDVTFLTDGGRGGSRPDRTRHPQPPSTCSTVPHHHAADGARSICPRCSAPHDEAEGAPLLASPTTSSGCSGMTTNTVLWRRSASSRTTLTGWRRRTRTSASSRTPRMSSPSISPPTPAA